MSVRFSFQGPRELTRSVEGEANLSRPIRTVNSFSSFAVSFFRSGWRRRVAVDALASGVRTLSQVSPEAVGICAKTFGTVRCLGDSDAAPLPSRVIHRVDRLGSGVRGASISLRLRDSTGLSARASFPQVSLSARGASASRPCAGGTATASRGGGIYMRPRWSQRQKNRGRVDCAPAREFSGISEPKRRGTTCDLHAFPEAPRAPPRTRSRPAREPA